MLAVTTQAQTHTQSNLNCLLKEFFLLLDWSFKPLELLTTESDPELLVTFCTRLFFIPKERSDLISIFKIGYFKCCSMWAGLILHSSVPELQHGNKAFVKRFSVAWWQPYTVYHSNFRLYWISHLTKRWVKSIHIYIYISKIISSPEVLILFSFGTSTAPEFQTG